MKKITIGYLFNEPYLRTDEKIFLKVARDKNVNLIMFNTAKDLEEEGNKFKERIKQCDIFFNNSAEEFAIEIVKTIEELGKKVIEPSKEYYYEEDKWLFFLKCKEYKIPTLKTILLSQNWNIMKRELENFGEWPVILKRITGTNGEYVDKADNIREAEKIINRFWKKGSQRLPIIAQEFIRSPSYRATIVGNKIVQTAIKNSKGWKATGVYLEDRNVGKFKIDKELKKIADKIIKGFKVRICGIDLFKKDGKWLVLEINSAPGLDFFNKEEPKLVGEIIDFLKKEARKKC
jgi:glutathione synthase/RimK-type ligase-like ATP-grasp enzyme